VIHNARVQWQPRRLRSDSPLPSTLRYIGLARFPADSAQWPDGAWSIEVRFREPPVEQRDGEDTLAEIRYLFDDAPQSRLFAGATFSLYEGPYKVADVYVLD
jgi:hypothetical protein